MAAPLAYLNGRYLPASEAALPIFDAGFSWGATVVDNARTYRGKLFRWPDHLARFRRDCEACFVPLEAAEEVITSIAEELIARNLALLPPDSELQLVTFATPGALGLPGGGPGGATDPSPPTLGLYTYPLPFPRFRPFFTEGASLAIVGHQPFEPGAILPPVHKHRSRMAWWRAEQLAKLLPGSPPPFPLLTSGAQETLAETSFASFLCVIGDAIAIPPAAEILDGISLLQTVELCQRIGCRFERRPIPRAMIPHMSEAMLTGTAFGLAGVRSIDGHVLPWPGPITRRLIAAWSEVVGLDLAAQFLEPYSNPPR